MFIRPLNDLKVRDPISKDHLPLEGRTVTPSPYWTRRLTEGAIEVIEKVGEPQKKVALAKTSTGAES